MTSGCFTWWYVGPLHRIVVNMKKEDYLDILTAHLSYFVEMNAYPEEEVMFQQDGVPKHTSKFVKD